MYNKNFRYLIKIYLFYFKIYIIKINFMNLTYEDIKNPIIKGYPANKSGFGQLDHKDLKNRIDR